MQKTLTINGKRYTGKQIAQMFDVNVMTRGGDYLVYLNGQKYIANYRQIQDAYYAPVCNPGAANAISLMSPCSYSWDVWLSL